LVTNNLDKFRENATDSPHVDLGPVVGVADQKFWSPVPPRGDIVRQVVAWAFIDPEVLI
jgi:hypothetical protein